MKLYATTRSERASKAQGGNRFLDIDIQAGEERTHLLRITIEYKEGENDKYGARVAFVSGDNTAILYNLRAQVNEAIKAVLEGNRKGEKKKDEGCNCGNADCTR